MKTFVILWAAHTYNYGNFMMLINMVDYCAKRNPKIQFLIEHFDDEGVERLKRELSPDIFAKRFIFDKDATQLGNGIVDRLIAIKYRNYNQIKEIKNLSPNALLFLSGDHLSEVYKGWRISQDLLMLRSMAKHTPVFLIGQTIGPFHSWRKRLARWCFKNTRIFLRDTASYKYLSEQIGIKNSEICSDLAFLDLPNQDKHIGLLTKKGLVSGQYITIVPSGLVKQYTSNSTAYISAWCSIIKACLEHNKMHNKKLVLLAHEIPSDAVVIKDIYKKLPANLLSKIVCADEKMLASEARVILGNGVLTITGRMHASISTFAMGIPAIPLSYSMKYNAIIGQDLDMANLIVEAKNEQLLTSQEIVSNVMNKFEYVLENYDEIKPKIVRNVKILRQKAMIQIDAVCNI